MPQVTSQRSQRPQSSLWRRKQHLFRFEHKFQWIPTNTDNLIGCYRILGRIVGRFWTLGSSQLHETQHVIVLHTIQPQAPLWNQHWKKKAQEFNKHRKTIYRFLMLVFLFFFFYSSRNPLDNCSVHNSFVQSWTSHSAQPQHSSWEAIGRRSGAGCDVPRCGPNLCTCLAISHWLDLKTAMASFWRTTGKLGKPNITVFWSSGNTLTLSYTTTCIIYHSIYLSIHPSIHL